MINFTEKPMPESHKIIRRGAVMGQIKAMWEAEVIPQIVIYKSGVSGIPQEHWNDQTVILNIGLKQIGSFHEGVNHMEFCTRFNGKSVRVIVPYESIMVIRDRDGHFMSQMPCFIHDIPKYNEAMKNQILIQQQLQDMEEEFDSGIKGNPSLQIMEGNDLENLSPVDPTQINLRHKTERNGGKPKLSLV